MNSLSCSSRSRRRFSGGLLVAICLSAVAGAAAQQPDPPLTMGRLALISGTPNAAFVGALRTAVVDPDPGMRFIAARIASILRSAGVEASLRSQLAVEENEAVAGEVIRALLVIGTPTAREAAEASLGDNAGRASTYAFWLARADPARLIARLGPVAKALGPDADLSGPVRLAVSQHPALRARLLRAALDSGAPKTWAGVLDPAPAGEALENIVRDGLRSSNPAIRERTVWQVVDWLDQKVTVAPAIVSGAASRRGDQPPSWEQFGREIVTRFSSGARPSDRSAWLREQADAPDARAAFARTWPTTLLTPQESAIVDEVRGETKAGPRLADGRSLRGSATGAQSGLRTLPTPWPGFFASLLAAADCRTTSTQSYGALSVLYRPDGRIASASGDVAALSESCRTALAALTRVTIADETLTIVPETRQWLLVSINEDILTCQDRTRTPGMAPEGRALEAGGAGITEPRKTHDVRPQYPASQVQARIQGTVIMETTIDVSGCVRDATILRGVSPALDVAGMVAVLQWRYAPALLNGRPVPALMTVNVNFALN